MRIDGSASNLGEFDGATTYPIAMPVMLFIAAATLVSFIIHGLAKRFVFGLIGLAGLSSAAWISSLVATRNIVALDPQLERLTGIAKTHGVADLQVNTTFFPWVWVTVTGFLAFAAIYLAITKSSWLRVRQPKSDNRPEATTTIDLWEQQRD
jgi:uncharacterized membrane protein (TIGR02234 family)